MKENPFIYSDSNKRYYTFDYYLKSKYNKKVFKVALNAGFNCPNRDGKISTGGCIYCSNNGSGEYGGDINISLKQQYLIGLEKMRKKWPNGVGIAYFQAFTNTYGTLGKLHNCFDQFVDFEDCIGISIATRPDCLNDEIIEYLSDLNKKTDLYVELGLQSSNDETGKLINRGYNFDIFELSCKKLAQNNIKVVVHIINGLPSENIDDMINTIKKISILPIFGIKFHCLNILKNTTLEKIYKQLNLHVLSKDEYLNIVSKQLTFLPSHIVVERINTDSVRNDLIAPLWNDKKISVSNDLDKIMSNNKYYQSYSLEKMSNIQNFIKFMSNINISYNDAFCINMSNLNINPYIFNLYNKVFLFNTNNINLELIKRSLNIKYDLIVLIIDLSLYSLKIDEIIENLSNKYNKLTIYLKNVKNNDLIDSFVKLDYKIYYIDDYTVIDK